MVTLLICKAEYCFATGAGTAGAAFLKIGVGARPEGMCGAYVSVSNDLNSLYWNPAGLSLVRRSQAGAAHNIWLGDMSYENLGYVHKLRGQKSVGIMINLMNTKDTRRISRIESDMGDFGVSDLALTVGYGQKLLNMAAVGINAKIIRQAIDRYSAGTICMDIGAIIDITKNTKIGFAVQNIGKSMVFINQASPLPIIYRIGSSIRLLEDKLLLSIDVVSVYDDNDSLNIGMEYSVRELLYLRTGYKLTSDIIVHDSSEEYSAGIGIKFKKYIIDYAFVPYGVLGNTHRISILVEL